MLLGMAATFAVVATLAAVGGGWAVDANQYGRVAALVMLAFFGLTLLFPEVSARVDAAARGARRAAVAIGRRSRCGAARPSSRRSCSVSRPACSGRRAPGRCSGLILTGAALAGRERSNRRCCCSPMRRARRHRWRSRCSSAGACFAAMKRSLGAGEWVRRGLGVAVLAAVVAIALGLDTGFLTRLSLASTTSLRAGDCSTRCFRRHSRAMTGSRR